MHPKIQTDLHEDVLPWLMHRVEEFIVGNESIMQHSFRGIELGIRQSQFEHGDKLE
jgi:hypothetical protein